MAGVIVERRIVVYSYGSEGVTRITHRKPGTLTASREAVNPDKEREKEKKRLQAQAARNRRFAEQHKEY